MDGEAINTLITAMLSAGGIGGGALLFGIWDRKRQAKQETLTGNSLERKELSDNFKEYINRIEAENERRRQRNEDYQLALDRLATDKDHVWAAFRKFEGMTHELRHTAVGIIWTLKIHYKQFGEPPNTISELPHLPSIHSMYEAEKDK